MFTVDIQKLTFMLLAGLSEPTFLFDTWERKLTEKFEREAGFSRTFRGSSSPVTALGAATPVTGLLRKMYKELSKEVKLQTDVMFTILEEGKIPLPYDHEAYLQFKRKFEDPSKFENSYHLQLRDEIEGYLVEKATKYESTLGRIADDRVDFLVNFGVMYKHFREIGKWLSCTFGQFPTSWEELAKTTFHDKIYRKWNFDASSYIVSLLHETRVGVCEHIPSYKVKNAVDAFVWLGTFEDEVEKGLIPFTCLGVEINMGKYFHQRFGNYRYIDTEEYMSYFLSKVECSIEKENEVIDGCLPTSTKKKYLEAVTNRLLDKCYSGSGAPKLVDDLNLPELLKTEEAVRLSQIYRIFINSSKYMGIMEDELVKHVENQGKVAKKISDLAERSKRLIEICFDNNSSLLEAVEKAIKKN